MAEKIKRSIRILLLLAIILAGVFGIVFFIQAHVSASISSVFLEKKQGIGPEEAVVINFPASILSGNYASGVRISPSVGANARWDGGRRLVIRPEKFWNPEETYEITLPQARTILLSSVPAQSVTFSTIPYPRVTSVWPQDGEQDVLLGAEDPITVTLDGSTQGFILDFELSPEAELLHQNDPEKTEFKLLPKNSLTDGQIYALKIFVKYSEDDDSGRVQIYDGNFKTFSLASIQWARDYASRLEQAKKYTRAKITSGRYIDINLSSQIMTIFQDGKLLDAFLISSGKAGMATPRGTFKIENKTPRAWSREYGLFMPYWNAIVPSGKYGIHELPEWPGGYKEGAAHLGTKVSHGCVRLGVGAAKTVYDFAPIGTPVVIY